VAHILAQRKVEERGQNSDLKTIYFLGIGQLLFD
jgi:hypothetical protein